jgi:hypothetical protein
MVVTLKGTRRRTDWRYIASRKVTLTLSLTLILTQAPEAKIMNLDILRYIGIMAGTNSASLKKRVHYRGNIRIQRTRIGEYFLKTS